MTDPSFGSLIGNLLGVPLMLLWALGLLLYGTLPVMAWSAMRNIKGIRRQLERLNENLEARPNSARTGPLGI